MKLSYEQMIIELDKLFLNVPLDETRQELIERAATIEAYIEACGWSWESITNYMANEDSNERV